jgi:hypothetical protein
MANMKWTARVRSPSGGELIAQCRDFRELTWRILRDDPVWRRGVKFKMEPEIRGERTYYHAGLTISYVPPHAH